MTNTATAIQEPEVIEKVVAVIPAFAPDTDEAELEKTISVIESEANGIAINCDQDFEVAADFGRQLKNAIAEVKDFFKPMKDSAYKTHRAICERENKMLAPLNNAETTLKNTMGEYTHKKEMEQKRIEAEARRLAQEEADRKLAEAMKLEAEGKAEDAAAALVDATMADNMSKSITLPTAVPTAQGISQIKDWQITDIDEAQVPVLFAGVTLRVVDKAAISSLIKASKGTIQIPGVTYREIYRTSIRR